MWSETTVHESKMRRTTGNCRPEFSEVPKSLKSICSNLSSRTQSPEKRKMAEVAMAADTKIHFLRKENSLAISYNFDWLFTYTSVN